MIKPVHSSDKVKAQLAKKFGKPESKKSENFGSVTNPELQAAKYKYGLACLWAATVQLENARLRQELANATAQANYCRACC